LLLSLGAPFWYSRLQDLLRMRSTLAQKDDQQRNHPADDAVFGPGGDAIGGAG
jgi:hypothetical protein